MNKHNLIIKPRAVEMAQEAFDWYEEQQAGLGDLFLAELENGFDKLETWPSSYAIIKKNYRQFILRTFPYAIVYEILNSDVVIYAVFHTSRNPRKKFKK